MLDAGFSLRLSKSWLLMHTAQIGEDLFRIDLQTAGYPGLFASYVLKGSKTTIVDPGPLSSAPSVLSGLRELGISL